MPYFTSSYMMAFHVHPSHGILNLYVTLLHERHFLAGSNDSSLQPYHAKRLHSSATPLLLFSPMYLSSSRSLEARRYRWSTMNMAGTTQSVGSVEIVASTEFEHWFCQVLWGLLHSRHCRTIIVPARLGQVLRLMIPSYLRDNFILPQMQVRGNLLFQD